MHPTSLAHGNLANTINFFEKLNVNISCSAGEKKKTISKQFLMQWGERERESNSQEGGM